MKLDDLLYSFDSEDEVNDSLSLLHSVTVEIDSRLISKLTDLIKSPSSIENTHAFASLLREFACEEFVAALVETISQAEPGREIWLADYLYALGTVLSFDDIKFDFDESFVHLLGNWLQNSGGGEIAWKSAIILAEINHPACREYYVKGVKDTEQFHQTRIACLGGLVNQYGLMEVDLYRDLEKDEDPIFSEALQRAIMFMEKRE
jgi:hypothetical protein